MVMAMTVRTTTKGLLLLGLVTMLTTGCDDGERVLAPLDPMKGGSVEAPTDGAGGDGAGGSDVVIDGCEDGAIQSCKIQIDEHNCFVGAQQCSWGEWGPCLDPDELDEDVAPAPDQEPEDDENAANEG